MKKFSLMKTLLHSSHFSHFSMATSLQPGPWATELFQLQKVFSLILIDLELQPKLWLTKKLSPTQHTKFFWKQSPRSCEVLVEIPSRVGQLWVSRQIFKKNTSSGPLKGERCFELSLERNLSSPCAHPRPVAIALEINESQGKHSGKWWQLYV